MRDEETPGKPVTERFVCNIRSVTVERGQPNRFQQCVAMRVSRRTFPGENVKSVGTLVGHDDVARRVGHLVYRQSLPILRESLDAEQSQLLVGSRPVRIRVVLSNAQALIAGVHVAQGIVDDQRFDLLGAAPLAELANLDTPHSAVAAILLLVSFAATWIPAARAARTDPMRALGRG